MLGRFRARRGKASPASESDPHLLLARRADGLGERLNALLNAMRLSWLLGVEYRFTWPVGNIGRDPQHAIVRADQFFAADFCAAHQIGHADTRTGFTTLATASDLGALREQLAASERGLLVPARPLRGWIDPRAVPGIERGFSAEFAAVGFHPRIDAVIAGARAVPLDSGAVGIHLRAGDIQFGKYRTWTTYWHKAIPVPIARKLIQWSRSTGRDVLIFGQDGALIRELCASTGAVEAATLRPPGLSAPEAAMFDLVLLSRCVRIISGWSGFAIQAAAIADSKVEHHFDLVAPDVAVAVTRDDLAENGDRYDPVHQSFAWWAAYYVARHQLPHSEAVELVERALAADPGNPRSRLRLAALHYQVRDIERGDDVLIAALHADAAAGGPTLASVMVFSAITEGGRFDSEEIVEDIGRGALDGPGPASIYRAAIRARRGDVEGANADLADFQAFIASDALMDDLDADVVQATIYARLMHAGRKG